MKSTLLRRIFPYLVIAFVVAAFFYKTVVFGKVPFAGDLLLTEYGPWRHAPYFGYVAGALPSKGQYFDVVRELYPWKTLTITELKAGRIPLWNPYNFSGTPHLANYQSQVLYPPGIVYFLLPQKAAWTLMTILQPLMGMAFTYLFASTIGLSTAGALVAAVAFNFSSFANVWMEFNTVWHTVLWLPLLLYFVERRLRTGRLTALERAGFIVAVFSSATAGHPQDFINTFLFFIVYATARCMTETSMQGSERLRSLVLFAGLSGASFLLAGPQLFPTAALFAASARVTHDYKEIIENMLIQPWQLGLLAVQDFFGNPATKTNFLRDTYVGKTLSIGAAGFALALVAVFRKNKPWHLTFFTATALVVLFLTVNTPIARLCYRYPIPVLSTGTPTRVLFLLMFAMAMLAGYGADAAASDKERRKTPFVFVAVVFGLLWAFALFKPTLPGLDYAAISGSVMRKAMLIGSFFAGMAGVSWIIAKRRPALTYALVCVVAAELLVAFVKFNPFVPPSFVFPENPLMSYLTEQGGIDRFWGYGTTHIEANFATQYRLFSPDGTDPLNLKAYNAFIQASRDGNIARRFTRETRSDAGLAPGYGEKDLPDNRWRLRIMDMLGIRYVIDRTENPKDETTFHPSRFTPVWHKDDWTVYRNEKAAPRFFFARDIRTYTSEADFERQFFDPSFEPANSVLVAQPDMDGIPDIATPTGTVNMERFVPGDVRFVTTTASPQFLFLSDAFDTGWNAYVDGKKSRVIKTNYAFLGVPVPTGNHTIELKYEPVAFRYGLYAAAAGTLVAAVFIAAARRRKPEASRKR